MLTFSDQKGCPDGGRRYDRFNSVFMSSFEKTKAKRKQLPVPIDDGRWCPLANDYDEDIHDAVSQMRGLDGTVLPHAKDCPR